MSDDEFAGLNLRPAIRALLIDPADRTLLVRFVFGEITVWAPPGGGIEPGEDPIDALHRELAEEVGLLGAEIGPAIWIRTHVIPMGRWDGQRDIAHLVRCDFHEPNPHLGWEQLRAEHVHELRWWTLEEVEAAATGERMRFAPLEFPGLFRSVLIDGPPDAPVAVVNRFD